MSSILWRIPPCGLKWGNSLLLSVSTWVFAFVLVSIDNNSICISICSFVLVFAVVSFMISVSLLSLKLALMLEYNNVFELIK